jgi:L-ascorbate metabolism protein UlaG (beta-lactamase superfamily)
VIRFCAVVGILGSIGVVLAAQAPPASVTITWLGQSTFVLNTSTGLKALLDPTNPGAYNPPPVSGVDVVTVTHEHPDHSYVQMATGTPLILRGLTTDGYAKVDQTIKGVRIRTVRTYHDEQQGAQRGRNAVFVFEVGGLKVAHLGDLGHRLDEQQVAAIGPVDLLLTPVAGGPTIDAKTALAVIDQLKAKVIVPMHYATPAMTAASAARGADPNAGRGAGADAGRGAGPGAGRGAGVPMMSTVDEFLKLVPSSMKVEQAGHTVELTSGRLPSERTVMVMKYE